MAQVKISEQELTFEDFVRRYGLGSFPLFIFVFFLRELVPTPMIDIES